MKIKSLNELYNDKKIDSNILMRVCYMDYLEILKILRDHKKEIKQKFGVKRLGVFGSYVRGEQTKDSDIDIVVEFEKVKKTFDNFMDLIFFLEELLGKKVDLVTLESVSPFIRPYVEREIMI